MQYKNKFVQITNEVYRLTLLFPKKEPLRYKMRELAGDILANSILLLGGVDNHPMLQGLLHKIDVLDSYFCVVQAQNWVKAFELLHIQQEYNKLKQEVKLEYKRIEEKIQPEKKSAVVKSAEDVKAKPVKQEVLRSEDRKLDLNDLAERQKKIIQVLKKKKQLQVGEMTDAFPNVTKRTLRRDFHSLFKKGFVERKGQRNETYYQLKR